MGLNSTLSDHGVATVHAPGKRGATEIQLFKFAKGDRIGRENDVLRCRERRGSGIGLLGFILLWLHYYYGVVTSQLLHDFKRAAEIVAHFSRP